MPMGERDKDRNEGGCKEAKEGGRKGERREGTLMSWM